MNMMMKNEKKKNKTKTCNKLPNVPRLKELRQISIYTTIRDALTKYEQMKINKNEYN